MTVDPITVSPDISAARATALAKSASAKNDPSLELTALLLTELQLVSLSSMAFVHDAKTESVRLCHIIDQQYRQLLYMSMCMCTHSIACVLHCIQVFI